MLIPYKQSSLIDKNEQHNFNGGYLFLQDLYHKLGLHKICKDISLRYKFTYNLDSILSRLIYGRILFPSSKLNTFKQAQTLMEQPDFELQHVYRALEIITKESDFIQAELYKNSLSFSKRNDRILYYECTNYFFKIEQEDGIPLTFSIHSGNTNEQLILQPSEQQLINDFSLSKFIVCTDARLSSTDNRKFNDHKNRAFITTQSIK